MQVKVKTTWFHGGALRRRGTVFSITPSEFNAQWMEKCDGPPDPPPPFKPRKSKPPRQDPDDLSARAMANRQASEESVAMRKFMGGVDPS